MSAAAAYTENFNLIELMQDRMKKMVVQEMRKSYLYYRMTDVGNVMSVYDNKEVPFYLAPPQIGKWITKGDLLPDAPNTPQAAMGYFNNRYVVVPEGFDMLEMMEIEHNPQKVIDRADLQSAETAWALRRTLASALWNGIGGKQPDGLTTIIEAAAPAAQTAVVGGVDKATKAWFRNQYVQLTQKFGYLAAGTNLPAGLLAALQLIEQCTIGTLIPSDLVTTKAVFGMFKRAMLETSTPYHLITERAAATFGFKNFLFDGSYLAWDPNCPADKMYALHLEENFDPDRVGNPKDKAKLDRDLEDIGKSSVFDMSGSICIIQHPDIKMRKIAPRTPLRGLQQLSWMIHSFNLGVLRLSDQGVLGDDGGSKLSTWS